MLEALVERKKLELRLAAYSCLDRHRCSTGWAQPFGNPPYRQQCHPFVAGGRVLTAIACSPYPIALS